MEEKNTYNRTNVFLGGGLDNTRRLLDVHGREMTDGLSVLGGAWYNKLILTLYAMGTKRFAHLGRKPMTRGVLPPGMHRWR